MFRLIHISFILVLAATTASCTLGKNYARPDVRTPSTYRGVSGQPSAASLADLQWFELFRDDTLVGLVKTALQDNSNCASPRNVFFRRARPMESLVPGSGRPSTLRPISSPHDRRK